MYKTNAMNTMKKIMMFLMLNVFVLSTYAQREDGMRREKVTCDGRTETVCMWSSGTGEFTTFCIADSTYCGYIPQAYSLVDYTKESGVVYKDELKDWGLQIIEEIIPSDTLRQIAGMCREDENLHFMVDIYFDESGKGYSYMLIASTKLYEKLTKEQFVRIAFRIKDLEEIPFTKYYDFSKPSTEIGAANQYYGRILFDVCELLNAQKRKL